MKKILFLLLIITLLYQSAVFNNRAEAFALRPPSHFSRATEQFIETQIKNDMPEKATQLFKYVRSINIITEERGGLGDLNAALKIAGLLKRRQPHLDIQIIVKSGWVNLPFLIAGFDVKGEEVVIDNGVILINGLEKEIAQSGFSKGDVNIYTGFVSQDETLEKYRIPTHRAPINIFLGEYDYGLVNNTGYKEVKDEDGNILIFMPIGLSANSSGLILGEDSSPGYTKSSVINAVMNNLKFRPDSFNDELFRKFVNYEWYGVYAHSPDYVRAYLRILHYAIEHDENFARSPKVIFLPDLNIDYSQFGFNYFDFTDSGRKTITTLSNVYFVNIPKGHYWNGILTLSNVSLVTGDNSVVEMLANRERFFYEIAPHKADFATNLREMTKSALTAEEKKNYGLLLFHNLPAYLSMHSPQFNPNTSDAEIENMIASFARMFTDPNVEKLFKKIGEKITISKGNAVDNCILVIQQKEGLIFSAVRAIVNQFSVDCRSKL